MIHQVGRHTFLGEGVRFDGYDQDEMVVVGAFCSIARDVRILGGGGHVLDAVTTFALDNTPLGEKGKSRHYKRTRRPTAIGNDVWIGTGAMILPGVRVGDGAVVGAGAVVHEDVKPYWIVYGNPAVTLFPRFKPETIERLLKVAWWRWPDDVIKARVDWFYEPVEAFLDKAEKTPW